MEVDQKMKYQYCNRSHPSYLNKSKHKDVKPAYWIRASSRPEETLDSETLVTVALVCISGLKRDSPVSCHLQHRESLTSLKTWCL